MCSQGKGEKLHVNTWMYSLLLSIVSGLDFHQRTVIPTQNYTSLVEGVIKLVCTGTLTLSFIDLHSGIFVQPHSSGVAIKVVDLCVLNCTGVMSPPSCSIKCVNSCNTHIHSCLNTLSMVSKKFTFYHCQLGNHWQRSKSPRISSAHTDHIL